MSREMPATLKAAGSLSRIPIGMASAFSFQKLLAYVSKFHLVPLVKEGAKCELPEGLVCVDEIDRADHPE